MDEVRNREESRGTVSVVDRFDRDSKVESSRPEDSLPKTGSEWFGLDGDSQ